MSTGTIYGTELYLLHMIYVVTGIQLHVYIYYMYTIFVLKCTYFSIPPSNLHRNQGTNLFSIVLPHYIGYWYVMLINLPHFLFGCSLVHKPNIEIKLQKWDLFTFSFSLPNSLVLVDMRK